MLNVATHLAAATYIAIWITNIIITDTINIEKITYLGIICNGMGIIFR